jgi:hypothetical protein
MALSIRIILTLSIASGALLSTAAGAPPAITHIGPNQVKAGSPGAELHIEGSGFVNGSQVRWNGAPRPTVFQDPWNLTAQITAADVATPGSAQVKVQNPAPGGEISDAFSVTITLGNPNPALYSMFPEVARAGSSGIPLELSGDGFIPESQVLWNATVHPSTFVNSESLRLELTASDLARAGSIPVAVSNPGPGGGASISLSFRVSAGNPVPQIISMYPGTVRAGSTGITLEINGQGFVPESVVQWNGTPRKTIYLDFSFLSAEIPSEDLAGAGTAQVTIKNPVPEGGTSEALDFLITAGNPLPILSSIEPDIIRSGSPRFTLQVDGDGFVPQSVVRWNGAPRPTTFVSGALLQAVIPASDVADVGNALITVFNPEPEGGTSESALFTVTDGNPVPRVFSCSPGAIKAGSPTFQLGVYGSGFVSSSRVLWNGTPQKTTFQDYSELTAEMPALSVLTPGQFTISVSSPVPGGGTSNTISFTVSLNSLPPEIGDISPDSAVAGSESLELTVTGGSFVTNTSIRWNGAERPTTFLNNTQLRAIIPASDLAATGSAAITTVSPPPGGGTSKALTFTVSSASNPLATIDKTSPVSARAGGPGLRLSVTGSGFTAKAQVRWNGSERPTNFESNTLLTALLSAADIRYAGTGTVTVYNPAPGGGESQGLAFPICSGICVSLVSPNIAPQGSGDFKLTVFGSDFTPALAQESAGSGGTPSQILWNGQPLSTAYVSSTQLSATVPAALVSSSSAATVAAGAAGAVVSNSVTVLISQTHPAPLLLGLNPPGALPGSAAMQVVVAGSHFSSDSKVLWNGEERATTFLDSTQLRADIPAGDVAVPGVSMISVRTPTPGGGTSNEQAFVFANSINYPWLVSRNPSSAANGEYTGIALVNLSAKEAMMTFTAYDRSGELINGPDVTNPIAVALGPRSQLPVVDYQIFGTGLPAQSANGWFRLGSSENRLVGFFLVFDDSLSVLDGVDVSAATVQSAVISEIEDLGFTRIHVVNPDTKPTQIDFELVNSGGSLKTVPVMRTVGPDGAVVEALDTLFPGITPAASDYLRVVSARNITVFALEGQTQKYIVGLNGQDATAGSSVLYSPQYVVGGGQWRTAVSVVNLEGASANVTLKLFGDDGVQIGSSRSETIPPRGKLYIGDQKYFLDPGTKLTQGYLSIQSDGPRLAGSVVFGDPARQRFASALPLVSSLQDKLVFSQLASNDTYFTGLAVLNPNKTTAKVSIEVYDENGNIIASKVEEISPGRRLSQLLTQYFPGLNGQNRSSGYFRLSSDQKVASFALFGTGDLNVLSAIPPQIVP